VNLKEAAQRLGVHYQTAYQWVRAGQLVAVRVGGRYEVSPAAIARFEAGRRVVLEEASPSSSEPLANVEPEDFLEELEARAMDPFVAISAVAAFVARRGAEVIGDMCFVAHCDDDDTVDCLVVDHPDPGQAALLAGALFLTGHQLTSSPGLAFTAYSDQRILRVPHVPQDWLRQAARSELLQHLSLHPIHSLLAAPVILGQRAVGVIVFTRDAPDRPYTADDEEFAQRLAVLVGALFETAGEVEATWKVRGQLVASLGDRLTTEGADWVPSRSELEELIEHCPEASELPVVILDPRGRFLAVNAAAVRVMGHSGDEFIGRHFESVTHPDELGSERANFGRLVSGELDFLDIHARRIAADGTELAYASQRAAIRDPDATLRFVVSVARPLHIAKGDYGALLTEPRSFVVSAPIAPENQRSAGQF
jgi:PAS domain S-box/DNA binding domain, excisionase family